MTVCTLKKGKGIKGATGIKPKGCKYASTTKKPKATVGVGVGNGSQAAVRVMSTASRIEQRVNPKSDLAFAKKMAAKMRAQRR